MTESHQQMISPIEISTGVDLHNGDCLAVLRDLPDNSVDAVVTDPPYGLSNTKPSQVADVLKAWVTGDTEAVPAKRGGFMGKDWDSFVPPPAVWKECLRVLKPGGHMAVFAGARTQDLMGMSIRLAGFEIRDTLGWIYGSGFPKSMNVAKAITTGGGRPEDIRRRQMGDDYTPSGRGRVNYDNGSASKMNGATGDMPLSDEAKEWDGWGTALKPAIEPIILARKPLDGTVAGNVLAHGVGGLNIDASRVSSGESAPAGRFPANVLLDEHAAAEVDGQSDGSSRFFPVFKYQAKAPKRERPVIEREDGTKVQHPTVKPVALMEWLVTLITPPGGTVLDPFAGSGTTLQAARNKNFNAIGIEREPDYCELIHHRLGAKSGHRKDKNDPDS